LCVLDSGYCSDSSKVVWLTLALVSWEGYHRCFFAATPSGESFACCCLDECWPDLQPEPASHLQGKSQQVIASCFLLMRLNLEYDRRSSTVGRSTIAACSLPLNLEYFCTVSGSLHSRLSRNATRFGAISKLLLCQTARWRGIIHTRRY
jgi:hypothetical protein